ncbi:unnamed protein product [marine sediment metagenome]|uniref:Uncharacterized protein n=1 Tax=marine sediment metagenome TaxID=412755 RepID=X0Y555_9ZZZZ
MLVICNKADEPGCVNACEHCSEHERADEEDEDEYCDEYAVPCPEINDEEVICIPVSEFILQRKIKNLKKDAQREAKSILKEMEVI